jgi:cytochrome c
MPGIRSVLLLAALASHGATTLATEPADAQSGKVIFEQLCGLCHSASADGAGESRGPNLFGLIGRKAASEPNFAMYSPALAAYDVKWSAATLDEFLGNPLAKVPGTTMPVMLANEKERASVIAYLASLK